MQNVVQGSTSDSQKLEKVSVQHEVGKSSTPLSSNSSPTKSETETYSELQPRFMTDSSESEGEDDSEVESFVIDQADLDEDARLETSKFLLASEDTDHSVDPETQARLEALLEAAGIGKLSTGDGKHLADPEVLRRLTSSVSCALDEAAAALTRMRTENPRHQAETRSLVEACSDGDVGTVRKLLGEGRSVHETTEEGESLLSLACSAGYYELAQVLLAMHANVEDRGIKGDCTPLMEAASAGHVDIVRLLIAHTADVNAQSSSGNTPLMYACAGGHEDVVRVLLENGANVEDHNENGHTPLMEAASAGHVGVAKILLQHGAGINTHSNEFKESALTLACYKGHLDMVRFLLEAGADQEHKTDEMHTALMEASMDGHVEVARLLLDSGAQVNMPTDSFESPLTLAACGGHVDLAMLLIERGAKIEEVNDEGYTPLMEAAREGHEEMVALLLSQGANINAQTEETQETALTLACCGGFLEVADFLIKAGADIELGASTPLMEAAQEGHLDLVRYLLEAGADVRAQTQTGDTALTYACENGHTDVADLLLQYGAELEHESEGGRTPLMKACRAGHLCTVQFLITKRADVNKQTTNNDHTPLSLACAGGHMKVVELLLTHAADPFHKLKDNSTMLIEASKGGHTVVVQLLLDYPHSIMMAPHGASLPQMPSQASLVSGVNTACTTTLHEVPEAVRVVPQEDLQVNTGSLSGSVKSTASQAGRLTDHVTQTKHNSQKSLLRKNRATSVVNENLTTAEVQQVRNQPLGDAAGYPGILSKDECCATIDKVSSAGVGDGMEKSRKQHSRDEHNLQKQQILEELHRVERELQEKGPTPLMLGAPAQEAGTQLGSLGVAGMPGSASSTTLVPAVQSLGLNTSVIDLGSQPIVTQSIQGTTGLVCTSPMPTALFQGTNSTLSVPNSFYGKVGQLPVSVSAINSNCLQNPISLVGETNFVTAPVYQTQPSSVAVATSSVSLTPAGITQGNDISVSTGVAQPATTTAISDRPKAKPVSKKETKVVRKQQMQLSFQQQNTQTQLQQLHQRSQQLLAQQHSQPQQQQVQEQDTQQGKQSSSSPLTSPNSVVLQNQQQLFVQLDANSGGIPVTATATAAASGTCPSQQLHHHVRQVLQQKQQLQQQIRSFQQQVEQQFVFSHQTLPLYGSLQLPSSTLQAQTLSLNTTVTSQPEMGLVQRNDMNSILLSKDDLPALLVEEARQQGLVSTRESMNDEQVESESGTDGAEECGPPIDDDRQEKLVPTDEESLVSADDITAASVHEVSQTLEKLGLTGLEESIDVQDREDLQPFSMEMAAPRATGLEDTLSVMTATPTAVGIPLQVGATQTDGRVEYFAVPSTGAQLAGLQAHGIQVQHGSGLHLQYQQYQLTNAGLQVATSGVQIQTAAGAPLEVASGALPVAGGIQISGGALQVAGTSPGGGTLQLGGAGVQVQAPISGMQILNPRLPTIQGGTAFQSQLLLQSPQLAFSGQTLPAVDTATHSSSGAVTTTQYVQSSCSAHQVQVGTQTSDKKKSKKARLQSQLQQRQQQQQLQPDPQQQQQQNVVQNYQLDPNGGVNQYATNVAQYTGTQCPQAPFSCMDVDSETDSNHDTALTLACAGGHEELVELLLSRGADIEHRDKKGFTPLILAATAGHEKVVEILLNHGADIEAQSERTKDTPLSLACSGGRYEVVELLLSRGANKEHRNVSDYTPLSLAASGGYVNIIKLLLAHGAEINSRTGSKLGISPLMLAAMNGHTAAVKLLLDMGSDINAQIETNRNTALTLACFQGRHEVVSLLLDRKANVEHRAKTGLTPLMEAASGGYVDVGRVLLDKGADVNAPPVPSSRDTALTIAADKGHCRFVELLLTRGAQVEVKNKKGNSPLWLAANGGHISVVELLYNAGADIDSQDNRKVSCLMAAFRKGHVKIVKWKVNYVAQFPSDQEMTRYISTVSDKELLDKCQECIKIIRTAKDEQAAKANENATILLEEIHLERTREESKRAAAARKREKKKKKKLEKKEEKRKLEEENKKNEIILQENDHLKPVEEDDLKPQETVSGVAPMVGVCSGENSPEAESPIRNEVLDKEEGDSGIDANSQGSCSSNDVKSKEKRKEKKKKKSKSDKDNSLTSESSCRLSLSKQRELDAKCEVLSVRERLGGGSDRRNREPEVLTTTIHNSQMNVECLGKGSSRSNMADRKMKTLSYEGRLHPAEREDFESTGNDCYTPQKGKRSSYTNSALGHFNESDAAREVQSPALNPKQSGSSTSPKQVGKREEGWKEVVRKSKKVAVPSNAISRVIGRGGSNINAIRAVTGAHIEVEKQNKGQGERIITIKGSADATRQVHMLITALIKDPDVDLQQMLPKSGKLSCSTSSSCGTPITWSQESKTAISGVTLPTKIKITSAKSSGSSGGLSTSPSTVSATLTRPAAAVSVTGTGSMSSVISSLRLSSSKGNVPFPVPVVSRGTAPRLAAAAEKRAAAAMAAAQAAAATNTKTTMSYTTAIMTAGRATKIVTTTTTQTFAAKLTETTAGSLPPASKPRPQGPPVPSSIPSPKHMSVSGRPVAPITSQYQAPPTKAPFSPAPATPAPAPSPAPPPSQGRTTPSQDASSSATTPLEYSLFNDMFSKVTQQSMWGRENDGASQKGMNFASVAAAGAANVGTGSASNKFVESVPPQVDAAKAPGYRGNAVCSPVSSKTNTPPSIPMTPSSYQSSVGSNVVFSESGVPSSVMSLPTKPQVNPSLPPRPSSIDVHMSTQQPHMDVTAQNYRHTGYPEREVPRSSGHPSVGAGSNSGVASSGSSNGGSVSSHHVMVSSSSASTHMDSPVAPYTPPASSGSFGSDPTNMLLKMSHPPNGGSGMQLSGSENHPMMPYHASQSGMQQHFSQNLSSSTNTATMTLSSSMHSRLNPRAPDFASSVHLAGKQQQSMYNNAPFHGSMPNIQNTQSGLATILANSNVMSYPIPNSCVATPGKSLHTSSQVANSGPYPRPGPHVTNNQTHNHPHPAVRWPLMHQASPYHGNPTMDMLPPMNLSAMPQLAALAGLTRPTPDLLGMENGVPPHNAGSPNMSPSPSNPCSPPGPSGDSNNSHMGMGKMTLEDRKIPRPIGTERNWKNFAMPMEESGWMLGVEQKCPVPWSNNISGGIIPGDRHLFGPTPAQYGRPSSEDVVQFDGRVLEAQYQGHPDTQRSFHNGSTVSALSLMAGAPMPMLPHYNSNLAQDVGSPDTVKLEAPSWEGNRLGLADVPEKQMDGSPTQHNDIAVVTTVSTVYQQGNFHARNEAIQIAHCNGFTTVPSRYVQSYRAWSKWSN